MVRIHAQPKPWQRRLLVLSLLLSLVLPLGACGYILQPRVEEELVELRGGNYRVDPAHTSILFKVGHMGLSKYVGRFNEFDARLQFSPDDPAAARLDAVIAMASVDVGDAAMEERLRGSAWFDTEHYPQARFTTVSAQRRDGGLRFTGELTLRGVTVPMDLQVTFNGGAFNALTGHYTLGFAATGALQRSDFGMDQYIPAIGDTVELEVHAEFQRR